MQAQIWHALIQMIYEEPCDNRVVFHFSLFVAGEPVQPIIGGRTEGTVTRVYMTNERGTAGPTKKERKQNADES